MSEAELARIMDRMPYGLYIIGSKMSGDVNGMMADWVMQVSFLPRLVAVSLENDAHSLENIRCNRHFTVNFLSESEDGMALARHFAQPYFAAKVHGEKATGVHHKLAGVDYTLSPHGCPVLEGAFAWLECDMEDLVPLGDHTLAVGKVVDGGMRREEATLTSIFTGWNYSA
jgi:flavin reductase (DIM6/NTAB) family NADH-FMN oxidoreductase RutF